MPWPSRIYIAAILMVGAVLSLAEIPDLPETQRWLLLAVGGLACLSQLIKVAGPTRNSSYDLSLVVFGFALIELGRPAAVWVIVAAGVVAWLRYRDHWYIHTFNIGMNVISMSAAGLAYEWITAGQGPIGFQGMLGIVATIFIYTLVNHLMLGTILLLANGETFAVSGTFDWLILTIDSTLFAMGTAAALIWLVNPFAVIVIISPLYLIYLTLQVPALQRRAESDAKTGLFNARHFTQALKKELERADRFDRPLSVVMADMDYLRNINNTYGHLAGDVVLSGIAALLRKSVREYDVVARFGGEEFAVLLPEATPQDVWSRVESMRAAIEAAEFRVDSSPAPIKATMSFGIAGRQRPGQAAEEILQNADKALYQAKRAGRNRVCLFAELEQSNVGNVSGPPVTKEQEPARDPVAAPARSQMEFAAP
jgi:diguanylate cyclase (GGDEF)-like protein